ncbi:hypothetical protein V6N13_070182 [Hibiscus sabdariffa]
MSVEELRDFIFPYVFSGEQTKDGAENGGEVEIVSRGGRIDGDREQWLFRLAEIEPPSSSRDFGREKQTKNRPIKASTV